MNPAKLLQQGDALLIVDMQNDFCPGGALPVEGGHDVVPVINEWISAAQAAKVPVFASRDWHPVDHVSFKHRGGPWPVHCVQDTPGARFHPDLELPENAVLVSKGTRFDQDAYSAFENTGLGDYLKEHGIRRLWVGGLAQDVCVLDTVLTARGEGFEVRVIPEATRPVDREGGEKALAKMREAGAVIGDTSGETA